MAEVESESSYTVYLLLLKITANAELKKMSKAGWTSNILIRSRQIRGELSGSLL